MRSEEFSLRHPVLKVYQVLQFSFCVVILVLRIVKGTMAYSLADFADPQIIASFSRRCSFAAFDTADFPRTSVESKDPKGHLRDQNTS